MIDINATLVAQMLNFLILVVVLRLVAYKPIVKMLKEREERALERQRLAEEKKKREELLKRIFVIAVCVILILALSLPTMGLMFLGGNQ